MRVEGPRSTVADTAPLVRDFRGAVAHGRPDHPAIESDTQTDAAAAWTPLLGGTVSTVAISGKHDGIIRRPHVATLAARLGDALDRAV